MSAPARGRLSEPPDAETSTPVTEGEVRAESLHVLWLTPDKPADISVGRDRIADRLDADGIDVTVRGTTPSTVLQSLRERDEYDVIVGTTRSGAIAGAFLSAVTNTPFIVDHVDPIRQLEETHPTWLAAVVRWVENATFWLADKVLFVYDEEESRVRRFADAAFPTELGVDYDRIADPSEETVAAARRRLDQHDLNENVAIYAGGLEPIYHIQPLLGSVEHLDDWTLLVLGAGSLEEEVRRAADASDAVVFPGTVPHEEVPGFLHIADVGVCLVDDPRTLKVLEYGAAGLPTVHQRGRSQGRFGGLLEYCDPDPESIARAIQRASDRDAERLDEFVRVFDWDVIGRQYQRVILSTIADSVAEEARPRMTPPLPGQEVPSSIIGRLRRKIQTAIPRKWGLYYTVAVPDRSLWDKNDYQPRKKNELLDTLRRRTTPGDRVHVVGGARGMAAIIAARRVLPDGAVTVYEAAAEQCDRTREVARLNQVDDWVTVEHACLGPDDSEAWGQTSDARHLGLADLPPADIWVVDIEGAELPLFEAAAGEIAWPETLLVETHTRQGASPEAVIDALPLHASIWAVPITPPPGSQRHEVDDQVLVVEFSEDAGDETGE